MIAGSIEIQLLANIARLQSDMNKAQGTVGRAMKSIEASANLAKSALAGIAGGLGVRELSSTLDAYTKLTAQLKLATRSATEFGQAYGNVIAISQRSQADISAISALYARLSNSLKDVGITQRQVADISETISLALRVNGATAAETSSAMLQLSQAFGSGRLAGEEFRAVSEAAPGLLREIAKELKVNYGELKQLAADGKITADVLARAFTNPQYLASLREQVKEVATISSAFTVLKNNVTIAIGELDKASGASSNFARIIIDLANSKALRIPFETLAVLGANVAYVFKQVGNEIGGIAAQLSLLIQGDFAGAAKIREMMVADAKAARIEIDRLSASLMNPSVTNSPMVEEYAKIAPAVKAATKETEKLTEAQKEAEKWRKEAIEEYADLQMQALREDEEYRQQIIKEYADAQMDALKERIKAEKDAAEQIKKANQKASDDYLEGVKRGQEALDRENQRLSESLSRSITDGIFRGFENGKGFFRNFLDVLVNGLKTALVQPFVENIIKGSGIGSLFTSVSAFAGSGSNLVASSGGGFGNVFGGLKDVIGNLNNSVVGSIEKLGVFLSNGQGGLADKIGGFMGQYSSQIAGALSFAPAVFSLLQGDFKGAAFQGAGAGIGLALGGPVGGAIGSFLGGAIGGMFGKKKNPRKTTAMTSIYGANGLISSGQVNAAGKDTDMFAGNLTQLNNQFAKALGSVYEMFNQDIKRLQIDSVFSYKKGKQTIGSSTGTIDGKLFGFAAQGFGKDISAGFAEFAKKMMGEGLAFALRQSTLPYEVRKAFNGVISSSVIQAIVNSFANLSGALTVFEGKLEVTNLQLIAAANRTGMVGAKLAEVINGLAGDLNNFYNLYYTDAEKITDINKALVKEFTNLGLTLPVSKEAFRALVEGVDTTTVAGQDLFVSLLKLSPAFAQYMDAMNQQDQALQNQTESLKALAQQLNKDMFTSLFTYTRAQSYVSNGISLDKLPSYDVGTSFVPQTGPAMLHQGERVMTAAENRAYSSGSGDVVAELKMLRQDQQNMRAELQAIAINSHKSAGVLDRLDRDGFILRDVDNEGNPQIVQVEVV
jgi:tape measure domain-containing protein